jgi:hypothetical protein
MLGSEMLGEAEGGGDEVGGSFLGTITRSYEESLTRSPGIELELKSGLSLKGSLSPLGCLISSTGLMTLSLGVDD